jgi:hypothetical protein
VWFYKRDQVSLSLETRYDNETAEYVAIVVRPDGRQLTEHFSFCTWQFANQLRGLRSERSASMRAW